MGQRTWRHHKTEQTFKWPNKTKDHVMRSIDILEGKVREGQAVYVDAKNGALQFRVT
jgi:hypothetical protein